MPKKGTYRRADYCGAEAVRKRREGGGYLPQTGDQPSLILHLEEAICRDGHTGVVRAAATARGERSAKSAGRGPIARPADLTGDRLKRALKPRQRCRLARWAQAAHRAARLMGVSWATFLYKSHKKPQERLIRRLREMAATHVRYSYRRLAVLLRRD
jgi:hypothetical protein